MAADDVFDWYFIQLWLFYVNFDLDAHFSVWPRVRLISILYEFSTPQINHKNNVRLRQLQHWSRDLWLRENPQSFPPPTETWITFWIRLDSKSHPFSLQQWKIMPDLKLIDATRKWLESTELCQVKRPHINTQNLWQGKVKLFGQYVQFWFYGIQNSNARTKRV